VSSSTFTAYIQFPMFSPDWRTTVHKLADLANLCYTEFVNDRVAWKHTYLFEVFGKTEDIEWFVHKLLKEDRRGKYIKYHDQVELSR
jgi:hypothetical protein